MSNREWSIEVRAASRARGRAVYYGCPPVDFPNLQVGADGSGTLEHVNKLMTLGTSANSLFKSDGTALVIHAGEDDEKTDPAGNSGARIACGLIVNPNVPGARPPGATN